MSASSIKVAKHLRKPRSIRKTNAIDAWYYINPNSVDVMVEVLDRGTFSARLTRRQLELALAAMEKCK